MIRLEDYLRRVESIQTQYDYAREAIVGFIMSKDPQALKPKTLNQMIPLSSLADDIDDEFIERMSKYVESLKGGFPDDKKDLENRLAQNEIILLVAVFEDFMKSIHREMLRQNPKLLSPDPQIKLGRLIESGETAIIEEEIERTVRSLDYKNVQDKAKAFDKLGLQWSVKLDKVERVLQLRNEILHEDIDKEVTGWNLSETRILVVSLPSYLCLKGNRLYPDAFEIMIEMIDYVNRRSATEEP